MDTLNKILKTTLIVLFLLSSVSDTYSKEVIIKKSRSNICHAPGTTYYKKTKYYKSYKSLKECIKSGGRMPRR